MKTALWKERYRRTDNAFGNVLIVAAAYFFILPLAGVHLSQHPALTLAGLVAVGVGLAALAQRWGAKNVLWYAWNGFKLLMLYLLGGIFLWALSGIVGKLFGFAGIGPWVWAVLLAAVSLPWLLKQPEWRREVKNRRF